MMDNNIKKYEEIVISVLQENSKYLYFVRGEELQKQALDQLLKLKEKISSDKREYISQKNEFMANSMLSFEFLIQAHVDLLNMIISLKNDDPESAWTSLIQAESNLHWSAASSRGLFMLNLESLLKITSFYENYIFPPQTYNSIEAVYTTSQCSICKGEYGECDHIKGRAYMGEMCYEVMTGIKEFTGLSIVDEPASKHHRITHFSDAGHMINVMTLRKDEKETQKIEKKLSNQSK
jgi:hypothetical protein